MVIASFEALKIPSCPSLIRSEVASSFVNENFYHVFIFFRPNQLEDFSDLGKNLWIRNLSPRVIEKVLHVSEDLSPVFYAMPSVNPSWVL
jgi:hypothetical protein